MAALARYVHATYPRGFSCVACIGAVWRNLFMPRGVAQGRPLSPALASILLNPAIRAAHEAMAEYCVTHKHWSVERCRTDLAAAGYLDDVTLVGPADAVRRGLDVFADAVRSRGWSVNMDKTVVGCG